VKVLVATAMYPTPGRPAFGSFVRTQVESLKGIGVDADPFVLEGRSRKIMYLRGIPRRRRRLRRGEVDVVHAHYSFVGTDVGDVAEVIGDTEGCYAVQPDPDAFADRLEALLRRPMRAKRRDRARHLDGPLVAARLRDLYDEVLERCRRHPREARAAW
jgi:hypothetical protein